MNNNKFEQEVNYFTELVFNNIQSAMTKRNKKKAIFNKLQKYLKLMEINIKN